MWSVVAVDPNHVFSFIYVLHNFLYIYLLYVLSVESNLNFLRHKYD